MDKKFLDKVVDQIVSETRMDFKQKDIHVPFFFTAIRYMLTSCLDHIDPLELSPNIVKRYMG